jgi:hypothetical protein
MEFTFWGNQNFNFHALGSTINGQSYCNIDVYVNGRQYWRGKFIGKNWAYYTIPASVMSTGQNRVEIILTGRTHFWIDEAFLN